MAGLLAYRPGHRGHFYYRLVAHRGRKNERRSLSEADYAALLRAAHHQLHVPIILIWHNLNTHVSRRMQKFVAAYADRRPAPGLRPRAQCHRERLVAPQTRPSGLGR